MPQTGERLRGGVIRLMANTVVRCSSLHSSSTYCGDGRGRGALWQLFGHSVSQCVWVSKAAASSI